MHNVSTYVLLFTEPFVSVETLDRFLYIEPTWDP